VLVTVASRFQKDSTMCCGDTRLEK